MSIDEAIGDGIAKVENVLQAGASVVGIVGSALAPSADEIAAAALAMNATPAPFDAHGIALQRVHERVTQLEALLADAHAVLDRVSALETALAKFVPIFNTAAHFFGTVLRGRVK